MFARKKGGDIEPKNARGNESDAARCNVASATLGKAKYDFGYGSACKGRLRFGVRLWRGNRGF